MPRTFDSAERMRKHAAAHLRPGERYVAAQPLLPRGSTAAATWHGAAGGGAAGSLAAEGARRSQDDALAGTTGDARLTDLGIRGKGALVAVTDQRLLVFVAGFTGRPKELRADHPLGDVELLEADHATLGARARVLFFQLPDGSVFAGEAQSNGRAADVLDAFAADFRAARAAAG